MMDDRDSRMGLCAIRGGGDSGLARLVSEEGAAQVWDYLRRDERGGALASRAKRVDLDEVKRQTSLCGARFITPSDEEWPVCLADLSWSPGLGKLGGEPLGLWVVGQNLGRAYSPGIAIIGSRASTAYGEHVASDLAFDLAERHYSVISGGAYGIDACAHRGAIGAGGMTVAVMAGGLAEFYPPGNSALIGRVRDCGAVISECAPDQPPSRSGFLIRNRLIAALGQATVIVEGAVRSGAQNTVSWALSIGRPVLAVPGPVTSAMSATPHRLIRDGEAVLVTSVDDVVAAVKPLDTALQERVWADPLPEDQLPDLDKRIFDALPKRRGLGVDELCDVTGESAMDLLGVLTRLEEAGLATETKAGEWKAVLIRKTKT